MILPVPVRGKQKSVDLCNAFVQGAPKSAFGFVFYGVNDTNMRDWLIAQKSGHDWFYIDNSYFDAVRGQQYRVTKNRIQIDARGVESDGKRFETLGIELKPWRSRSTGPEGHVVLVQQSDAFMRDIAKEPKWFDRAERMCAANGWRTRVRLWGSDKLGKQTSLEHDLVDAVLLVTHSSAAAVTAACGGVLPLVESMSALAGMPVSTDPSIDRRRQWMNVLADNQFDINEIRNGKAWSWLAKR